jgi:Tat protein translocase TatB subunit
MVVILLPVRTYLLGDSASCWRLWQGGNSVEIFGIGTQELLVILILATIVLGPERMVRTARELGKHARNFKAYFSAMSEELKTELDVLDELNKTAEEVKSDFKAG